MRPMWRGRGIICQRDQEDTSICSSWLMVAFCFSIGDMDETEPLISWYATFSAMYMVHCQAGLRNITPPSPLTQHDARPQKKSVRVVGVTNRKLTSRISVDIIIIMDGHGRCYLCAKGVSCGSGCLRRVTAKRSRLSYTRPLQHS
jgi:hypothetical protein